MEESNKFLNVFQEIVSLSNYYFEKYKDDKGHIINPISKYISYISDKRFVANSIKGILYNYRILGKDKEIDNLVDKLFNLI